METIHTLLLALSWLPLFNLTVGLQCYKCFAVQATLNGDETNDTAEIVSTVERRLSPFLGGVSPNDDCMSTDVADLQSFEGAENSSSPGYCGYLNMTLTNENYDGKGELVEPSVHV